MHTDLLSLPLIMPAQAQKHLTHNEALTALDALVQIGVEGETASPPASPRAGDRLIVAVGATDAFAGQEGSLAVFRDGAWQFIRPQAGWLAYDRSRAHLVVHDGLRWTALPAPRTLANLEAVGIAATADGDNRLAVASNNTLFDHAGASHRLKVNKAGAAETGSLLFQTDYSGRAEVGLAGSDDFAVKVSADGAAWREAIRIERSSGRVQFPSGGAREQLAGPRTYHVAPSGNDAGDGLTASAPFATLQRAVDAALTLDAAGQQVIICLADGTYASAYMRRPMIDGGLLSIEGNAASPQAVLIDGGNGPGLMAEAAGARLQVQGVTLAGLVGAWARLGAVILMRGRLAFGPASARHVGADNAGYIEIIADIEILGDAPQHFYADWNGHILMTGSTITLTGERSFPNGFAVAHLTGVVSAYGNSYGGSAQGPRFRAVGNGVIFVNGAGDAIFPGDAPGMIASGGQYL